MIQQAAQGAFIGDMQRPRCAAGSGHIQQLRQGQAVALGVALLWAVGSQRGRIRAHLDRQRREVRDGCRNVGQRAPLAQGHMGSERRLGLFIRADGHGRHAHIGLGHHVHGLGAGERGEVSALGLNEFLIRRALVSAAEQEEAKEKKGCAAQEVVFFHACPGIRCLQLYVFSVTFLS